MSRNRKKLSVFSVLPWFVLLLIISCLRVNASEISMSKGQIVYVPAYSYIYSGDKEKPFMLAVTLSIRNIDMNRKIKIDSVEYYDSEGKLAKTFLAKSITLKPLESTRYIIKSSDSTGGSGANFIIKWASDEIVNEPIIETIMIGTQSQQGVSFTSRGKVIKEIADNNSAAP